MILLDTCAIIWDAIDSPKLTVKAKKAIENADKNNALIISDISIWEISMLINKGRIQIDTTAANFVNLFLQSRNVMVKSISAEIAELSVNFGNDMNSYPADRIIAATSIVYNARLVTSDENLQKNKMVDTLW